YLYTILPDLLYHPSFFFFQAEDGIRDFHVTGVQTCALPILEIGKNFPTREEVRSSTPANSTGPHTIGIYPPNPLGIYQMGLNGRSEERRVGKECRAQR